MFVFNKKKEKVEVLRIVSPWVCARAIYATDTGGNTGASEIIYFTKKTKKAEPFQTLIVAAIVVIAVVAAALLAYFTKVKKTTEKTK